MMNPNRVIIENTLQRTFHLVLCVVNRYNEEKEAIYKKSRKQFLKELHLDGCSVTLVNNYPPDNMKMNVFYVKRDGKTVWFKTKESVADWFVN